MEGESLAVTTNFSAELTDCAVSVFWSALGAGIAGGARQTSVRAGQTSLLLVVEEGSNIAGRINWSRVGIRLKRKALSNRLVVTFNALTGSEFPIRVRLLVASVARSISFDTFANACETFSSIAFKTNALTSNPLRIDNRRALRVGHGRTFTSVVEAANRAEAAVISFVDFAASAGEAAVTVPEAASRTDTLSQL